VEKTTRERRGRATLRRKFSRSGAGLNTAKRLLRRAPDGFSHVGFLPIQQGKMLPFRQRPEAPMYAVSRVLGWSLKVGAICFAAGFFGPMILAPDANQGPLLGILITGPLGLVLGGLFGVLKEILRARGGDGRGPMLSSTAPTAPTAPAAPVVASAPADYTTLLRGLAAGVGIFLAVRGVMGLRLQEGRGAASAVVLSIVAFWFAVTGRVPSWFRR